MKIRGLKSLGAAQSLALLAALGSATAYAAWLDARQLALWALALGAGRAAMLLVDGGFKSALVRHAQGLSAAAERRLTRWVMLAALGLAGLCVATAVATTAAGLAAAADATLVAVSVLSYLLSHALSLVALARLERSGRFDHVGRAEGAGTVLEFALPAALIAAGLAVLPALMVGVVLGRLTRTVWLLQGAARTPKAPGAGAEALPWREGLTLQGIAGLSMLRDQVHLWLVAPWFGAVWAGAYAFGLMACALASQVLVATVARVAMPALRPLSPRRRALRAARSLRRLALLSLPLLALTLPALHWADAQLWAGRWQLAVDLLPGLMLRMALGLPLAVLSPWLLVAVAPRAAARTHLHWTVAELALALLLLLLLGPGGLAVSWAVGGAIGTVLFARALRPHGLAWFWAALLRLPGNQAVQCRLQPRA